MQVKRDLNKRRAAVQLSEQYVKGITERVTDIGKKVEYLLNTGNLASKSGLDLSQVCPDACNAYCFALPYPACLEGACGRQQALPRGSRARISSHAFLPRSTVSSCDAYLARQARWLAHLPALMRTLASLQHER